VAKVIPLDELRRSPTAALFEGRDDAAVSVFVTRYERGQGPSLHRHPYPEVFVVHTGTAKFRVGEEEIVVGGGHVVVVPAETAHAFESVADDVLNVVGIHPSREVVQTDLE
jgi:quercetin dioxygenase-like cupin family protein